MSPARVGGLLCFAAGCVFVVLASLGEREPRRLAVGTLLIVVGLTWWRLAPVRRNPPR